jgi:broad specificity phosphatase PhoE
MRVLLLRHAESANPGIFHGAESDVGLSERGHRQAEAIAPVLAALKPTRLVSSAMRRARDTADPIARACGLEMQIEPDLHERRVGALTGTPTHGSDGVWPDTLRRWLAGETEYAPPGAESFDDLRNRLLPAWQRVVSGNEAGPLIVVAHGIVCKVLLFSLLPGYSTADWHRIGPIFNVSISELHRTRDCWSAVRINEVAQEVAQLDG